MKILITGIAGFIGYHLASRLLKDNHIVYGIDSLNEYYDVNLKKSRLENLKNQDISGNLIEFIKGDLSDNQFLNQTFSTSRPELVINLAAQAGVRYSIENPSAYVNSNLVGFANILECCRHFEVKHLIYASSSSVYGGNVSTPFKEDSIVDHPVSLYAVTKKSNELMAHCYSHLYDLPTTGLRFFTVYGPFGRPDMALFLFTKSILNKQPINIFNNGEMIRDFTYIDDVVESINRLVCKKPEGNKNFNYLNPDPSESWAPFRIFNIGNSNPVNLMEYITTIEEELGIKAIKNFMPMQMGDVKATHASTESLEKYINFKPRTSIREGISRFIAWYRDFYGV